jgi:hypothetical protein
MIFASLAEFFEKVFTLGYWEVMSDIHGGLSMLSLVLFGASFALYFSLDKFSQAIKWLQRTVLLLLADIAVLDVMGLFIYRPYRAPVADSPRSILKSSEATAWLHSTVFEHKEFLAFAPLVIMAVAAVIIFTQGKQLRNNPVLKRVVLFSIISALVMVLVVATEAVLVTKTAPLR